MKKGLRVVVLGAGKMGAHHARVFAAARGATLVGVLDVDRGRASAVAHAYDADALRNEDEAIERADLVVVATPTSLHFSQAKRALTAGRHVLVEKPLCQDSADAHVLCALAVAHRVRLFVGHSERFNPVVRAIARASKEEVFVRMTTRRTAHAAEDDLCLNLAVHDIDLVAFLFRVAPRLESATGNGDESLILLRAGDALAQVSVGRSATRMRSIQVQTNRSVYLGDLVAQRISRDGVPLDIDPREPLALQAQETIDAITVPRSVVSHVASGDDGARAVHIAVCAASNREPRVSAAE